MDAEQAARELWYAIFSNEESTQKLEIALIVAALEQARREEREACAMLVEHFEAETGAEVAMLHSLAAAIRARAQEREG